MNFIKQHSLACLLVLMAATPSEGTEHFSFADNVLTITTDRYEVRWKSGSMVEAKTFLPEERVLAGTAGSYTVGSLPNGPSLRPPELKNPLEYHPWMGMKREQVKYQVNASPALKADVKYEKTERGAKLLYEGLGDQKNISWIQEFEIDPDTGDLVIRQKATSPSGHLSGISFGIYNLDAKIPLAVPNFPGNGQLWNADHGKNNLINIAYPRFWSAGLIIGMPPEGGSFAVWSDEARFLPKYFRHFTDGRRRNIGFEASLNYPYKNNRAVEVSTWRFNTFEGNWTEPAGRYREHLQQTHSIKPLKERTPGWGNDLALIWSTSVGSPEQLKAMSEKINPAKVLIWDWQGSTKKPGINADVPDYIPQDGFAERNKRARDMGFHIAAYYSMALIDVQAHPDMIKQFDLGLYYDALWGAERTDVKDGGRLIYVHPGSPRWRQFYADRMKQVFERDHVDMLYQDVAGTAVGSSGISHGLNFSEAIVAADADIHEAVLQALIGGEYWNEATIVHESIGLQRSQDWGGKRSAKAVSRMDLPHPICSFLFSPFSYYYAYKVPQRSGITWHRDQNMNEVIGSLPEWLTDVDDQTPEARITLLRAKLWEEGFKPWFPETWEDGVASYMRNDSGDIIRYRRDGNQSFCTRQDAGSPEKLFYGRVSGVEKVDYPEPIYIQNWMAYDAKGPIGLDPEKYYCIFPGAPAASPLTITKLPEQTVIKAFRKNDQYLLATFDKPVGDGLVWKLTDSSWIPEKINTSTFGSLLGMKAVPEVTPAGQLIPPGEFDFLTTLNGGAVGEIKNISILTAKHGQQSIEMAQFSPPLGGKDSEAGLEKLLTLPEAKDLALAFTVQRLGGAGDGVHLVVRINGHEIWRHLSPSESSTDEYIIPLKEYVGRTIVLGLHVDAGPAGYSTSNDYTRIGNIFLTENFNATAPMGSEKQQENKTELKDETYR